MINIYHRYVENFKKAEQKQEWFATQSDRARRHCRAEKGAIRGKDEEKAKPDKRAKKA